MNMNHRPNGGNDLNHDQQQALIQTMTPSTKLYTIATTHESKATQQQHAGAHHTVSATTYSTATA